MYIRIHLGSGQGRCRNSELLISIGLLAKIDARTYRSSKRARENVSDGSARRACAMYNAEEEATHYSSSKPVSPVFGKCQAKGEGGDANM